ncbi:MAG: EAL domain-containing protein [Gammaproteobacteria bacterium]|nr:EAL domain-containing protein [Gammaproteobacteria bacterium]
MRNFSLRGCFSPLLLLFSLIITVFSHPLYAQQNERIVNIGVYDNAPLIFFTDNNRAKGLFADLIEEISKKQAWDIRYVPGSFQELLIKLENNQIDILPVVAYSAERARHLDFNRQNVLTNWAQIYTLKDSELSSLTDLSTKKVAVLKKDIHYTVVKQLMEQFGLSSEFVEVNSYEQVLLRVSDGSVDAGVTNRFFGNQFEHRYQVEKSGIVFNPIKIHFAFAKNKNIDLLKAIDEQLILLKHNRASVYYQSIDHWLGGNVPVQSVIPWVMAVILILFLVLFLIHLLIKLTPVRQLLGLSTTIEERVIVTVLIISFCIALFSWALITALDYLWFNPSGYDLSSFVLPVNDQNRLFYRVILIAAILISGLLVSRLFSRLISGQKSLLQSESRFRNLFEASEVSVWDEDLSEVYRVLDKLRLERVTDLRNYVRENQDFIGNLLSKVKINRVNAATLKLFNAFDEKEFLSQVDKSFGPGAMDVFLDSVCAYWDGQHVFRSETNFISFDGRPIQSIISFRIPQNAAEYKNIAITIVDISDRVQAEQALIDNQQLLEEAQLMTHTGNWELDVKSLKAFWSEEVFSIFAMEITDDVGPACLEKVLHPDDRQAVLASLQSAVNDGCHHHLKYRIIRPDGEIRWIECQAVQKYNDQGEIIKLRGVIQDITERKQAEQRLISQKAETERSESKFKAITEQAIEGITVADLEGNYTFVNKAFCDMVGYSDQELLQMTVFDVKAPEQDTSSFERTRGSDECLAVEVYLQHKNGSVFIAEVIGKEIEFGGQTRVLGTIRDITRQVKADEQIRTLSQAIEQSPVSVMITDTDANIEYVNKAFEKITGYSAAEVQGLNPRILKADQNSVNAYHELWQSLSEGKNWQGELQSRKKNGEIFWEYAHFAPVIDEYGATCHYLAVKEDISLRKQQEEHILHQAHFDALTNLPNRFLSLDRLSQLMQEAKRDNQHVAVLFLDLDDFKKVNDTLGHETGDKLLIEASERLKSVIRSRDTIGRFGGDEFIVLLGGLKDSVDAQPVTENLLKRFRDAFKIDGRELMITLSVGIAVYPQDGESTSELLRNADSAMYHSKQLGRNTFSYFTNRMNRDVSRRLALEEQIHGALDRAEFKVFYQLKIDVNNGQIIGTEALLRWFNPKLGNVSPVEFIPIAEQTGLIVPLGKYVLTQAMKQTAVWKNMASGSFRMAVNLSPRQFRDPDLVSSIENAIEQSGLTGEFLELEITEGVLMGGHSLVDSSLAALSNLRISLAMDDFGTGYSSLSYLRTYPFDVLKIDRSFVRDITRDPADRELINATIAMAHGLNLKVVAEGVETAEQFAYLKSLNCDYVQGYLFGKPMTEIELTEILKEKSVVEVSQ